MRQPETPPPKAPALAPADRRALLELARGVIGAHLDPGKTSPPLPKAPALRRRSGAFVTLTIDGRLRGCIGQIEPRRPLAETVAELAIHAAFEDPRFPPLCAEEAPRVSLDISVLTPPRPVGDWTGIEIGRHGVILRKQSRSAVFLPQVATEQGWDLPEMLTHLALKAGLPPEAWREGARFEVFEADVFHETDA